VTKSFKSARVVKVTSISSKNGIRNSSAIWQAVTGTAIAEIGKMRNSKVQMQGATSSKSYK